MNRNLVGSTYMCMEGCFIKFPQSRMKGERHRLSFAMLGDSDLIFGIRVYNDELLIWKFTFRSGPMNFG
jgi:hypothetical protein